jgi:protein-tyrosine phosphatase
MTAADLARLADLGIVTVYDLRSEMEVADFPDPIPSIHVPLLGRFMSNNEPPDFAAMVGTDHGFRFMTGMLSSMLHWGAAEIGSVVTGLADADGLPAVFHCTAGKDRTGVLAALLLETLGVERDLVLDDFQLSEDNHGVHEDTAMFRRMIEMGMPPEAAAGVLGAPREMLAVVLDDLDTEFGGAERYLVGPAGVDPAAIDRLRSSLLG